MFVAAASNWLGGYENLSGLTPEQRDALCTLHRRRLSRQLYAQR